jgi:hypothetical protein
VSDDFDEVTCAGNCGDWVTVPDGVTDAVCETCAARMRERQGVETTTKETTMKTAKELGHDATPVYIEVAAGVRYWEDATVNGTEDTDGALIPLRAGGLWKPTIRLADGMAMDWPAGVTARVHYKVCDSGEYWLLDGERRRIAKWGGDYVPSKFLCHGDSGCGDYIILTIGGDGVIEGWRVPTVDAEEWKQEGDGG